MAWTSDFLARLGMGGEPMFALDFDDAPNPDAFDDRPERYILHTHGIGGGKNIAHALQSVSGPTQSVQLRSWQPSIGAVRATLSGVDQAYWIARTIPRGMLCRLKIGFPGMDYEDWGSMGVYQYKGISGARNNWQMEFGDFFAYMQSRYASASFTDMFPDAGSTSVLAATYATSDTVLTFADATARGIFTRDGESGASGLVYCQPTTGDPFYLKHTGESGAQLTVTASDVIGTTRVDMAAGDTITALGYVGADLPRILEKLLFKGASTAGTMPTDSNLGLSYDSSTIDLGDWTLQTLRLHPTMGDFTADFIASQPLTNPWAAISDFFAAFGVWPVMRQGALSFRAVHDIATDSIKPIFRDSEITDADIVSVENQQVYHPEAREEFISVRFPLTAYSDESTRARTMPANLQHSHASRAHVYDIGTATTNRSAASIHLRDRLLKWYTRLPMALDLNLLGWRWSALVPGDVVTVRSERIVDLINPVASLVSPYKTIDGVNFLVTSVAPDFQNFTTSISLARLPDKDNPYT